MSNSSNKKKSSLSLMFRKLFGIKEKEMDIMQEEQLQSPLRTILKNFRENKLAMGGAIIFLLMFLTVIIGPIFYPISLSDSEETQVNIAPGYDLMKYPKQLEGNVRQISTGATFSVGVDNNGKVYVWGKTRVSSTIDLADIPEDLGNVVQVSAGVDHVMTLDDQGKVVCWGNNRLEQVKVPLEAYKHGTIVEISAGYQISYAVTDENYVVYWGNDNLNDVKIKKKGVQGTIKTVMAVGNTLMGVNLDGEVLHLGSQDCDVSGIPEGLKDVSYIASTSNTVAAVSEDGSVAVWGSIKNKENEIPEMEGKIVSIYGGRFHYTALTDAGKVYSWGLNNNKQTDVADNAKSGVAAVYGGYYQNYAVTESGKIVTWGLKGYLLGSDELGRDVFARLLNGGRMTMTIGAISVVISTVIGIIIGGVSGFFGGWVDILLQRITEIVSSLPFLPLAMILTTIIGNSLPESARIFMIMIILGLLSWPSLARLVRAQVLAEREKEFVTAANAMGVKRGTIVFKHIIPNVISVIIVSATLDFASCMLTESSLSYLGFGVKLPRPTWGNMLNGCVSSVVIQNYWWRWVFPAIMLGICVICINMVGDGLRDAIDPKSNER